MDRCLILQNMEAADDVAVGRVLSRGGVTAETLRLHDGARVPADATRWGGIVVLGGPMSADPNRGFATLDASLDLLAGAIAEEVPVLGICLGAQMVARAAGATVRLGPSGPEIGWSTVTLTPAAATDPLFAGLPEHLRVMQWHEDTFDLPVGAAGLATGERYANQAFRVGTRAWGLQFHLEVDQALADWLVDTGTAEATAAGVDPEAIRAASPRALAEIEPHREVIFGRFAALVARA